MKKLLVILFINISLITLHAQNLKLIGDAKPGSIVIGKADNIKSVFLDKKKLQVDENGYFIFGFDRDAKGTHILKIKYKNKKSETKKLVLPKRKYEIQRLRVSGNYVNPPRDVLNRIEDDAKEIKLARKKVGTIDTAFFSVGFITPVDSPRITSVFGSQRILNGVRKKPHNGVDYGADEGTPVYSISDGKVILAGEDFYYNGNFILIDHGQGLTSVYLHMNKLDVKSGDKVLKGQKIGEVGNTGRSTAPHLHLGIQWFNKRIDPLSAIEMIFP